MLSGALVCLLGLVSASSAFNLAPGTIPGRMATTARLPPRAPLLGSRRAHTMTGRQMWKASAVPSEGVTEAPKTAIEGDFSFQKQWYPIFFTAYQDDSLPFKFTLMGHPLVFWKDLQGRWNAMADRCPHRLAPLSEGRVNEVGEIECPYHGWTFSGSGACTSIPQAEQGFKANVARSCGIGLQVAEAQGIVWVWPEALYHGTQLPPADEALIPRCPTLDEHTDVLPDDTFRDVPYDYSLLLENVLDLSHVPYTHAGSNLANRASARPIPFSTIEPTTAKGYKLLSRNTTVSEFRAPVFLQHTVTFPTGIYAVVAYATPTTPGNARILARFPSVNASKKVKRAARLRPVFLQHMMRNRVLEDDNIFLHVQERNLVADAGGNVATGLKHGSHEKATDLPGKWARSYYLAASADKPVVELRRWFDRFLPVPWAPRTRLDLEQDWSRERLLDRKTTHLDSCTTCQAALTRVKILRTVLAVAGAVAAAAGRLITDLVVPKPCLAAAVIPLVFSAVCALAWHQLGRLESRFYIGPYPPQRNRS